MKTLAKQKKGQQIIDKKLENNVVVYKVKNGKKRKWMSFQDLKDKIQLIQKYEEKIKERKQKKEDEKDMKQNKIAKESLIQKIQRLRKGGKGCKNENKIQINEDKIKENQIQSEKQQQVFDKQIEMESSNDRTEVQNIIFLHKAKQQLLFQVIFYNGTQRIMNNRQLKELHPHNLINFYENNVILANQ